MKALDALRTSSHRPFAPRPTTRGLGEGCEAVGDVSELQAHLGGQLTRELEVPTEGIALRPRRSRQQPGIVPAKTSAGWSVCFLFLRLSMDHQFI